MGVHKHGGTMPGAVTPICESCNVSLCWDISEEEYAEEKGFWDAWKCRDCNGGEKQRRPQPHSTRLNDG
jgi:hypothetical protein